MLPTALVNSPDRASKCWELAELGKIQNNEHNWPESWLIFAFKFQILLPSTITIMDQAPQDQELRNIIDKVCFKLDL